MIDFKPDAVVPKIAPRPILFIVAERDVLTAVELAKELYDKAGEPKRFVLVPGASHWDPYSPPYLQLAMDEAFAWFEQYIPAAWSTSRRLDVATMILDKFGACQS